MSLLTVIVPLYNNEQFIEQCINSICNQSYSDVKIVVVDDGSTDKGGELADEIARNDNRITVIHQCNKGPAEARYCGLKNCNTEYATFVDSDDFVHEKSYEYSVEYMVKGIDMIFFEISRYFNENHIKRERHTLKPGYYSNDRIRNEIFDRLIWDFKNNCRGLEPSQCVRITKTKLLIERYEEFSDRVYYGEDTLITYPLFLKIHSLVVVPFSYYMHRQYLDERPYIDSDGFFKEVYCLYNQLNNAFENYTDLPYDFRKQIDYLYMYLVQEKKDHNSSYPLKDRYLFPFNKTTPNRKILIYGAGNVGRVFYHQLEKINYTNDVLWVDRNANSYNDVRIMNLDSIKEFDADYAVIAINDLDVCNEVAKKLIGFGIEEKRIIFGCESLANPE